MRFSRSERLFIMIFAAFACYGAVRSCDAAASNRLIASR